MSSNTIQSSQGHPLDPLGSLEIARAAAACKEYAAVNTLGLLRFNTVMIQEPRKADLLAFEAGRVQHLPRQAFCILILPHSNRAAEAVVELGVPKDHVVNWKWLDGVQPMTTPEDNFLAEEVVKADPYIQKLLRERYGIEDVSSVVVDTWALHCGPEHLNSRRLMQGFLYMKHCPSDNEYAHPLDITPIVDLNEEKVVHVDMYDVVPRVPSACNNYHRDLQTEIRQDIKPLHVLMPQGPSFQVNGYHVTWQKWNIRLGFNCREGLVLHNVGYEDGGIVRPVFHRLSLVEMIVPYGDPGYPYVRKCALDVGDYGFGFCANSLELGCDCLGAIKYFDVCYNNSKGEPVVIKKAICMHEEDAGILWKHFDCRTNHVEVRRSRRLVISMIATFMNYEYCMYWYFYQDGTVQFEIKLSGILSTSIHYPGSKIKPQFGSLVGDNVVGSNHQHFFCMRIDPAVDDPNGGKDLVVVECNAEPLPDGPENPYGNGFVMRDTPLLNTHEAQRMCCAELARHWKFVNPNCINPVSQQPVAFKLYPGPPCKMMAKPYSQVAKRGFFASKNLWVTPHADDQRWPAGDHVVQSTSCLGLREWTREAAPLQGGDPVVWYSFGVTHSPRPEDYPVMPTEALSFMMKPYSFFTRNPACDIPATRNPASREVLLEPGVAADGPCCRM